MIERRPKVSFDSWASRMQPYSLRITLTYFLKVAQMPGLIDRFRARARHQPSLIDILLSRDLSALPANFYTMTASLLRNEVFLATRISIFILIYFVTFILLFYYFFFHGNFNLTFIYVKIHR